MKKLNENELAKQIIVNAREYSIGTVLFHHAVGENLGLNATDMECLTLIFFKKLTKPSELAHYTGLTTGAITQLLDRLEKAQLIRRQPNPQDRRGTLITLTEERIKEVSSLFAPLREKMESLVLSYSQKEQEVIFDYFRKANILWVEERKKIQSL